MNFEFRPAEGEMYHELSGGVFASLLLGLPSYEILLDGRSIGYVQTEGGVLGGFYVRDEDYFFAESALEAAVKSLNIKRALITSTQSRLLALCLDRFKSARAVSGLYLRSRKEECPLPLKIRLASESDTHWLTQSGYLPSGIHEYLKERALYICEQDGERAAFTLVRPCKVNGYAEIGVYVSEKYRFQGLGSSLIKRMSTMCEDYHITPLAVCSIDDTAFMGALNAAGYACFEKQLKIDLQ